MDLGCDLAPTGTLVTGAEARGGPNWQEAGVLSKRLMRMRCELKSSMNYATTVKKAITGSKKFKGKKRRPQRGSMARKSVM